MDNCVIQNVMKDIKESKKFASKNALLSLPKQERLAESLLLMEEVQALILGIKKNAKKRTHKGVKFMANYCIQNVQKTSSQLAVAFALHSAQMI